MTHAHLVEFGTLTVAGVASMGTWAACAILCAILRRRRADRRAHRAHRDHAGGPTLLEARVERGE